MCHIFWLVSSSFLIRFNIFRDIPIWTVERHISCTIGHCYNDDYMSSPYSLFGKLLLRWHILSEVSPNQHPCQIVPLTWLNSQKCRQTHDRTVLMCPSRSRRNVRASKGRIQIQSEGYAYLSVDISRKYIYYSQISVCQVSKVIKIKKYLGEISPWMQTWTR